MSRCRDFIKVRGMILANGNYVLLTMCDYCVHHSVKYNDCKIHGASGNNSTSVVHGEVSNGNGGRRCFK